MRRSCAHDFFPRKRGMNHYSARKKSEEGKVKELLRTNLPRGREGGGKSYSSLAIPLWR